MPFVQWWVRSALKQLQGIIILWQMIKLKKIVQNRITKKIQKLFILVFSAAKNIPISRTFAFQPAMKLDCACTFRWL